MVDDEKLRSWAYVKPFGSKIGPTTNCVHVGALVSIRPKASYWNGHEVERWYIKRKWYVTELEGNKATLGKDESGKYSMKTPVSTGFLTVIEPCKEESPENGE